MLNTNTYPVSYTPDCMTFEFISEGSRGCIIKVVQYTPLHAGNYYNLGFGDRDLRTGLISDLTVSDNGDRKKVLATVASTLVFFFEKYPHAKVMASGSTPSRTRLYRMGINEFLPLIINDFILHGLTLNGWEYFNPNHDYLAFLIQKK